MVDAARQMLDELMGRNRNLHPSEAGLKVNWEDAEYCQFYNVKFCPHDLFINTRADLGPCTRIHDDEAKHLFEEARPSQRKRQYEDEFLRFCNVMLHDVDRKIQKGKQRLQLMHRDMRTPQQSKQQEQINNLTARINKHIAEAEEAGKRGDVDQAQDLMALCEELKEEKDMLQQQHEANMKTIRLTLLPTSSSSSSTATTTTATGTTESIANIPQQQQQQAQHSAATSNRDVSPGISDNGNGSGSNNDSTEGPPSESSPRDDKTDGKSSTSSSSWAHDTQTEKQMKVCEICGAFLIVGDAQQRIEDHLMGKQHLGYSKLRNAVAEINDRRQKERDENERRRRDERVQRSSNNTYENRRDQRDYRSRSRDYASSRQSTDRRHHHHKSHHSHTYSRSSNGHSSGHRSRSRSHCRNNA